MVDVSGNYLNNSINFGKSTPEDNGMNTDAHYSDSMKVKRPKIDPNKIKIGLPVQKSNFSDKEATAKIQQLNSDIYEAHKKEKSAHEFSFKNYFKIIAGFVLAAASIAGIRQLVRLFRK